MKSTLNILGSLSLLFATAGPALAAPIDPPQVRVVFDYTAGNGSTLNTFTVYSGTSLTGSPSPTTTQLFGGTGEMPLITNGARARFSLYARNDTTDLTWLTKPLSTADIFSWHPSVGFRWGNSFGSSQMPFLVGPDQLEVYRKLGYSGALPTTAVRNANAVAGVSRMDWPSFFWVAGSSSVNPTVRNIVVTRSWTPYNTTTWTPGTTQTISMQATQGRTDLKLRLGTVAAPALWNNGTGLMAGPAGSNMTVISGVETYIMDLEPFSPDNVAGRRLGSFSITYWPQPSGTITVPPERVVGGRVLVDGSDGWAPELAVKNIFPGGRVYARVTGSGFNQVIDSWGVGPTNGTSFPQKYSNVIPQLELMPPVASAGGTYQLQLIHEYNGVVELLSTLDYYVSDQMSVRSNIIELSKPNP